MIAATDMMWNGQFIKAGSVIPGTAKKLASTLESMDKALSELEGESAEAEAIAEVEPAAKSGRK